MKKMIIGFAVAIITAALLSSCKQGEQKDLRTETEILLPSVIEAQPILAERFSCTGKLLPQPKFLGMEYYARPQEIKKMPVTVPAEELERNGFQYVGINSYYCDSLIWIAGLIGAVLLIILWYLVLSQKKRETPPPATPPGASSPTTALSTEITKVISGLTPTGGTVKVSSKGGDSWEVTIPTPPKTGASPKKETPTPDKGKGQ